MTKPMENKSNEIKAFIETVFPGTAKAIAENKCPLCRQTIEGEFKDILSQTEYKISGMCQKCQDEMWP